MDLFLVIERVGFEKVLQKSWRPLQHIYVLLVVMIGWVFFRAESFSYGFTFLKNMFFAGAISSETQYISKYLNDELPYVLSIAIIFSAPVFNYLKIKLHSMTTNKDNKALMLPTTLFSGGSIILYVGLMILSAMALASNVYNPFIYFRF